METNVTQEGVYTISVGEKTVSALFIFYKVIHELSNVYVTNI